MHVRAADGATTLVWMDSEEAIIVRWGDRATIERVRSEGCAHGHGDDDGPLASAARHGSGGALATARAGRDMLRRFTEAVASRVPGSGDVTVVGPGILRAQVERALRTEDRHQGRRRIIHSAASDRLTEQELVAHVCALAGDRAPRAGARG